MRAVFKNSGNVIISGAVIMMFGCGLFSFCPKGALA